MKFKDSKFGNLKGKDYIGNMDLYKSGLTSLEGSPDKVIGGDFLCDFNSLTSLKGGPTMLVHKDGFGKKNSMLSYSVSDNPTLMSLEGAPKLIEGSFFCRRTGVKNAVGEIIKYQIKAERYYFDGSHQDGMEYSVIKKEFEAERMKNSITSKGFRTLLGLNKWNSKTQNTET